MYKQNRVLTRLVRIGRLAALGGSLGSLWTVAAASQIIGGRIAYDSLGAAYTAALYAIEPAHGGGYQARNARQEIEARFGLDGLAVESTHGSAGLRIVRGGASHVVVSGNRIEYRREGVVEWYVNGAAAIEQGFTFSRRPADATPGAPLIIALALRGAWQPQVSDGGRAIVFRSGEQAELRYAGLKAWDARGRDLPARMEIAGREIRILVDDTGAVYPVTVDPVLRRAKLTASDSAKGSPCGSSIQCDDFGQSVSVSGDTVVAGAPGKNNTGAAYVFLRSVNDAASGVMPGSIQPGSAGTLSNNQCTISNAGATTITGNNLSLPVTVTFMAGFTGAKTVYGAASTNAHVDGSWQSIGTWTTP